MQSGKLLLARTFIAAESPPFSRKEYPASLLLWADREGANLRSCYLQPGLLVLGERETHR
jgi:hypothetical protein